MSEDITVSEDDDRITTDVALEDTTVTLLGTEGGPFRYEGDGEPPREAVTRLRDAGHVFREATSAGETETDRDAPEGFDDDVRDAIEELEEGNAGGEGR